MSVEFLKDCFENEDDYQKFATKVDEKGIKIADLTTGDYVAKKKYDDKASELVSLQTKYNELEKNNGKPDEVATKKIADLEKELTDYKTKYTDLDGKYNHYLNRDKVISSGFKKEFADFVVSEISKNVSENVDFETAMKGYKTKNPQYTETIPVIKKSSMPTMNGGTQENNTDNSFMNALIRGEK